jgi:Zn-dependent M16 (insulinase) family peptidase
MRQKEMTRKQRAEEVQALSDRYELLLTKEIPDLESIGMVLRHKKSGARVALLLNEDENKVFSIGFRTPPEDSTGVAHIVEHTVLCGSEQFPAKDSFVELIKGSLNTFLNAMTYPDKTVYPVASCNQKDFNNLMHVYLDAVFFPAIYRNKEIFLQEGWHYEVGEDGTLSYNGVVFNEMKGALSSPDDLMLDWISKGLFPDNTYCQESGGDPVVIPELSYEAFLEFHKKYYHPSNSYLYLYGDLDASERLDWIDREYLSRFTKEEISSDIPLQAPIQAEMVGSYDCGSEEDKESEWLSYSVVTGQASDALLLSAIQILEYALVEVPGAPVKKALLDAGIGKDVRGMFNTDMQQPTLTFLVKNAKEGSRERFLAILTETLAKQAEQGINEKSLQAAINFFEFRYREADYGYYPKGLIYNFMMLGSWLYQEENPFVQLEQGAMFEQLRTLAKKGYFEELIRTWILENPHRAVVELKPEVGRNERLEAEQKQRLQERQAAMSEKELEQIKKEYEALKCYQDRPSTKEELEAIPLLKLEDIEKETPPLYCEEGELFGRPLLRHAVATNGIVYLRLLFSVSDIPEEEIPYLGLLSTALGYVDSEHYTYGEFASEMLLSTGGITVDPVLTTHLNRADDYEAYMDVKVRFLEAQTERAFELTEEMLFHTIFGKEARMKEILAELTSRIQQRLPEAGNSTAITRGLSYVSASGLFKELNRGISYYRFLKDLMEHFEEKKDALFRTLNALTARIFTRDRLIISVTAGEKGYQMTKERLEGFLEKLPKGALLPKTVLEPVRRNEAFKSSSQVQYVGRVGNFAKAGYTYSGSLQVLSTILNYDYLWACLRVKGGAYGCSIGFGLDGDSYMVSYRDPNLAETEAVYEGILEYIKQFQADEREMTKYIIGTFSMLDQPLSPMAKGSKALTAWLRGLTREDYQRERDEALSVTEETIRRLAPLVQSVLDAQCRCTVGSEGKIEQDRALFETVERL